MASIKTTDCGRFVLTCGSFFLRKALVDQSEEPANFDFDTEGLALDVHGSRLAVGCKDGSVKLFDHEKTAYTSDLYNGSTPVRDVSFSPNGKFVSLVAYDKTLVVDVADITRVSALPLARHVSWHPKDNLVGISTQDGMAVVYNIDSQTPENKLEGVLPAADVADSRSTQIAWAPLGDVFAVPSKSFDVVIYSRSQFLEQYRLMHKEPIKKFKWSPNGLYMACLLNTGDIHIWDVASRSLCKIEKSTGADDFCWHQNENKITHVMSEGFVKVFAPAPGEGPVPFGDAVEIGNKRSLADDVLELSGSEEISDFEEEDADLFVEHNSKRPKRIEEPIFSGQAAFQSGATPWLQRKRILCANFIGYVWSTYQDDEHNTLTFSFFDQGEFRDAQMTDEDMYDLAALSKEATVLANAKTGRVLLRFHQSRMDSWDYNCDEPIRAVTLSSKVVVVCTESGYILTFSLYGNLVGIVREARDPVVACTAFEDLVLIVRATATGLSYTLENTSTQQYFQKNDALAVSPKHKLSHLFFSETGDPCIYDSSGVLSTLVHWRSPLQARWVPIYGSTNLEAVWPLGVVEDQLVCITLKNRSQPSVPLPTTSQVTLSIPRVSAEDNSFLLWSTRHTQAVARAAALQVEEDLDEFETELDRSLLVQIQSALSDKKANKALKIASLLLKTEAIQIAAQIAGRYSLPSVAEKIQELAE